MNDANESAPLLNAYMATALSGVEGAERQHVDFLSEIVGEVCLKHNIFLYQPRRKTDPVNNKDIPDEEVYRIDREKVALSDLVIMLCDYPSSGSGQENEIAAQVGIPVVLLIQKDRKISRMVSGSYATNYKIPYADPDDLKAKLDELLKQIVPGLVERRKSLEDQGGLETGRRIRELRHNHGLEVEELARILGVKPSFVAALETEPERVSNPSVLHIRRAARALGTSTGLLLEGLAAKSHALLIDKLKESMVPFVARRGLSEDAQKELIDYWLRIKERDLSVRELGMPAGARGAIPTEADWERCCTELELEKAQAKLFS